MGESALPRLGEVRRALRVVGECRDLGHDPGEWRRHACLGISRLLGARIVSGMECRWRRPAGPIVPVDFIQVGMTRDEHDRYFDPFCRQAAPDDDVLFAALKAADPEPHLVRTRRQDVADDAWYRCRMYVEYHEPVGIDDCAVSVWELPGGRVDLVGLHRDAGDRDFSGRQMALLRLFHAELGRLIGPTLTSPDDPLSPTRLPPRLRQTLSCLLEGDGERQVAARLGLSRPTVHQYVTALYRRYGVESRAELLARFIRRPPLPGGDAPGGSMD
ncbi:helix-turn-helix transcriptional regulator [Paludisphaera mucosa]|uniref:LuxR C-terminal-related transcriptional regulator n=1 Tax=Paludisphaera mucosa TaxID=3030827 RepID=A0ABT6FL49_9BACT|nr:helix-turn-helix transcriptional regulator [Paludisphaera mucosa]MDG3008083.1 LuxR C-terminal-related transcriptional regulator [Paludisphaera mucosa]